MQAHWYTTGPSVSTRGKFDWLTSALKLIRISLMESTLGWVSWEQYFPIRDWKRWCKQYNKYLHVGGDYVKKLYKYANKYVNTI